jgi:hypothetical protein
MAPASGLPSSVKPSTPVHSSSTTSSSSPLQYSTVQYSTVQYSTVQYSTVQYSSARNQATGARHQPSAGSRQHTRQCKRGACVRARVRACVRACVCAHVCESVWRISSHSSWLRNSRSRAATGAMMPESSSLPGCSSGPCHSDVNQLQVGSLRRAPPMQIRPSGLWKRLLFQLFWRVRPQPALANDRFSRGKNE